MNFKEKVFLVISIFIGIQLGEVIFAVPIYLSFRSEMNNCAKFRSEDGCYNSKSANCLWIDNPRFDSNNNNNNSSAIVNSSSTDNYDNDNDIGIDMDPKICVFNDYETVNCSIANFDSDACININDGKSCKFLYTTSKCVHVTGWSEFETGFFSASTVCGGAFGPYLVGKFNDRFGKIKTLLLLSLISFASSGLFTYAIPQGDLASWSISKILSSIVGFSGGAVLPNLLRIVQLPDDDRLLFLRIMGVFIGGMAAVMALYLFLESPPVEYFYEDPKIQQQLQIFNVFQWVISLGFLLIVPAAHHYAPTGEAPAARKAKQAEISPSREREICVAPGGDVVQHAVNENEDDDVKKKNKKSNSKKVTPRESGKNSKRDGGGSSNDDDDRREPLLVTPTLEVSRENSTLSSHVAQSDIERTLSGGLNNNNNNKLIKSSKSSAGSRTPTITSVTNNNAKTAVSTTISPGAEKHLLIRADDNEHEVKFSNQIQVFTDESLEPHIQRRHLLATQVHSSAVTPKGGSTNQNEGHNISPQPISPATGNDDYQKFKDDDGDNKEISKTEEEDDDGETMEELLAKQIRLQWFAGISAGFAQQVSGLPAFASYVPIILADLIPNPKLAQLFFACGLPVGAFFASAVLTKYFQPWKVYCFAALNCSIASLIVGLSIFPDIFPSVHVAGQVSLFGVTYFSVSFGSGPSAIFIPTLNEIFKAKGTLLSGLSLCSSNAAFLGVILRFAFPVFVGAVNPDVRIGRAVAFFTFAGMGCMAVASLLLSQVYLVDVRKRIEAKKLSGKK